MRACYEKIATPHHPLYYALRKIPSDKRDGVVAVSAFYQTLHDILLQSSEPEVALKQFHWWKSEVIKIPQKCATHPVTIALQSFENVDTQSLFDLVEGVEQIIAFQTFQTFTDLTVNIIRTAGLREKIIAEILGIRAIVSDEMIYQIAMILELTRYIQEARKYVRKNIIFIPEEDLIASHVSIETLQCYRTTPGIQQVWQQQADRIFELHKNIFKSHDALRFYSARCNMALATLRAIQKNHFEVLEKFIEITPFRMWWMSICGHERFFSITFPPRSAGEG